MKFQRFYGLASEPAEKQFKWKRIDVCLKSNSGQIVFEQANVGAPEGWSKVAIEIAASKYFKKPQGRQENSIAQLVDRVVGAIGSEAKRQKLFVTPKDLKAFLEDLKYILFSQRAFFNSPVWFNCGVQKRPQVSACFIQDVKDDIDGIFDLLKTEARIFKYGSGSGTNFSTLRSKFEDLQQGGTSSGMMAFLEVFDRGAGAIKSGGTTRRAAKMVCLDVDHPEVLEFIDWKAKEEKKAKALIRAGYSSDYEGEAYRTVSGQNSNNSIRITNQFMKALVQNLDFSLRYRTKNVVHQKIKAKEIWARIANAAWECGDPGLQFTDTINVWHTCPKSGPINASNPCSEYLFLDNSACNLASLNLLKFVNDDNLFSLADFQHTAKTIFLAQELLVGMAGYPTKEIEENSLNFRPIGLGFCGLGSFLMRQGIAYDSPLGRCWAAGLSSALLAEALIASSELASTLGPFAKYRANKASLQKVVSAHRAANKKIDWKKLGRGLSDSIEQRWQLAVSQGKQFGFRNAQFTVMAPTGTIGLVMDAETTGIEPEFSLVKYKKLAGQGGLTLINNSVPEGLRSLGYSKEEIQQLGVFLQKQGSLQNAPGLRSEHREVFRCAHGVAADDPVIAWQGHLAMMAAIQPFLSGGISKTVNLQFSILPDQIADIYLSAWQLGLKSIAIYRDGCKSSQPLTSTKAGKEASANSVSTSDSPLCPDCGDKTILIGGCYQCTTCGFTTGCVS